ncbi:helix-turn-helix domain-containing protein [Psychrobacillus sp. NPDC093180]|uniref:helix-turn-helix domain-containing protein n=1 Tax=Psychrobacillus sp. NPDC093180 TaxID=3364489 RepID=UPI00382C1B7F
MMPTVPQRLRELRKEFKFTQAHVAKTLNISESAYGYYEQGRNEISISSVQVLAELYDVSVAYILGESNTRNAFSKDEKDIAKRLEAFREEIENSDGLAFDGEPMSEEAKESLTEAMEHIFRQTQRINKKYIPKKYRDTD